MLHQTLKNFSDEISGLMEISSIRNSILATPRLGIYFEDEIKELEEEEEYLVYSKHLLWDVNHDFSTDIEKELIE